VVSVSTPSLDVPDRPTYPAIGGTNQCDYWGVISRLEWWPEYNSGPLWQGGQTLPLEEAGVQGELAERIEAWCSSYDDGKLPMEGKNGDLRWLEQGTGLLAEVRAALAGTYEVFVTEPWWGEVEEDFEQPSRPHKRS
jgi:hypothetical protein